MAEPILVDAQIIASLRSQVARLRRELASTTEAYRKAVAVHDTQKSIPLLRARSNLMRQLLDSQCELLLALRTAPPESV